MDTLSRADASSIKALAEHLGVAAEELSAWVHHPAGIPSEVLRSWIGRWNAGRLKQG